MIWFMIILGGRLLCAWVSILIVMAFEYAFEICIWIVGFFGMACVAMFIAYMSGGLTP